MSHHQHTMIVASEATHSIVRILSSFTEMATSNMTDNHTDSTTQDYPGQASLEPTVQVEGKKEGRDTYEFVAFLLWYLFLVVCCVLPTCCAYRRRRILEARMAEQQAHYDFLREQNIFILSNLQLRPETETEEIKEERTRRITEALQSTTFVSTNLYPIQNV